MKTPLVRVLFGLSLSGAIASAQTLNVTTLTDLAGAPLAVAVDSAGNLYVAESPSPDGVVEKITPRGVRTWLLYQDFGDFLGVAVDASGNVFVTNGDDDEQNGNTIIKITPVGAVSILAGAPGERGNSNGRGMSAHFSDPTGIAVDRNGNLYVADHKNSTIRKITPTGSVSTFAGAAGQHGNANGPGGRARFFLPTGIAVDNANSIWVLDTGNNSVRKVTSNGNVSTIARLPESPGGTWYPTGIAVYRTDIYIADQFNEAIRHVTPAGVVKTAAGVEELPGFRDGVGGEARFRHPNGIAVDATGVVYIADTGNEVIRKGVLIGGSGSAENSLTVRTVGDGKVTPNYSNAVLELGRAYTIKAKAARGFRFANWVVSTNGTMGTTSTVATLRFVMGSNLTLRATFTDIARPRIVISSPKVNNRVTNATVVISGSTEDNDKVASVWYKVDGNTWSQASGTTNWTVPISLAPGANTFRAYAVDAGGNTSITKSRTLVFAMPPQTLNVNRQ